MQLGLVTEQIWLTQTPANWNSYRLVAIRVAKVDGSAGGEVIAADVLGARIGEKVLVGSSSRVRDLVVGPGGPIKSVVLAIVDRVDWPHPRQRKLLLQESSRLNESQSC